MCSELCNAQSVHQNYATLKISLVSLIYTFAFLLLAKGKAKAVGDGYLGEFLIETKTLEMMLRTGMHFQTEN